MNDPFPNVPVILEGEQTKPSQSSNAGRLMADKNQTVPAQQQSGGTFDGIVPIPPVMAAKEIFSQTV